MHKGQGTSCLGPEVLTSQEIIPSVEVVINKITKPSNGIHATNSLYKLEHRLDK